MGRGATGNTERGAPCLLPAAHQHLTGRIQVPGLLWGRGHTDSQRVFQGHNVVSFLSLFVTLIWVSN